MFLLYDLIFLIYAIFYLPYLLLTRRGYSGYAMRFGLFPIPIQKRINLRPNIWVHAVSVGEVMLVDGFIDKLNLRYPSYQLVVTVTTKTGYALALKRLEGKAVVIPAPLDFSFMANRFVQLMKPRMYIAAETEIWPNLYRQLYRKCIPMAVINGRISERSFGRYKFIRFLLKSILNQVSVWCMQSQRDAQRIIHLGADASRVVVTGNIKFDDLPKSLDTAGFNLPVSPREAWWVAGSTHPGEEDIVLNVYAEIIKANPQWRLVIAPRHIERAEKIMELVTRRGFKAVKFSELKDLSFPNVSFGYKALF
jgi:3-deoxy-D-manno-octulosonic-acid transferase